MNILAQWSRGYCAARGYGGPVPALNGRSLWFHAGKPDQRGRYVLIDQDLECLATIDEPNIYVEIAGPRHRLAPHIPQGWQLRDPAYLMVRGNVAPPLEREPPSDVRIERHDHERSIEVLARTAHDELAARGVVGLAGGVAVFDQIVTEPGFRRRGLGSLIMQALLAAAGTAGATDYLLIATGDGRALYEHLGWTVVTDVVSIISPRR